jgi:hypothetical protein
MRDRACGIHISLSLPPSVEDTLCSSLSTNRSILDTAQLDNDFRRQQDEIPQG